MTPSSPPSSPLSACDPPTDSSLYVQPDIRRGRITLQYSDSSSTPRTVSIPALNLSESLSPGTHTLPLAEFTPWSLEDPQLYTLSMEDHSALSFGMREFSLKEKRFFFNNRPLYIKGLDCSTIRHTAPFSEPQYEAMSGFLGDVKSMGFNYIRIAVSALSTDILSIADTLGLLVEVVLADQHDIAVIPALRNHPSLVLWNALAIPDIDTEALTQSDPSRLYFYTDPATTTPRCIRPYRDDHENIELHTLAQRAPLDRFSRSYCEHLGSASSLSFVHSLEAGSMNPALDFATDTDAELQSRDLTRVASDTPALNEQIRALRNTSLIARIDALRANPAIAGYCVNILSSTSTMNLSDTVKEIASLHPVKGAQLPLRPLIHMQQHNLTPRQETPIRVHFLNETKLEGRAELSLQVMGPTNQVLWKKKRGVHLPKSGKLLWEGSIAASGSPGLHRFIVRVMQNMKRIAESTVEFYVYPEAKQWDGTLNLLDPQKHWAPVFAERVAHIEYTAPIHVIPPIASSIRAYPDNELAHIMGQVQEGAVALIFQPPQDWNDYARIIDTALTATPTPCNNAFPAHVHYAKMHPVFDALPARDIMGATYADLLPSSTFIEHSDEDICGTFCASPNGDDATVWGSDILVVPHGSGRLVFTTMPILENLGTNPAAGHLLLNLLKHFSRRSIPSKKGTIHINHASVEWMRKERQENTQHWALMGMFPHDPTKAKREVYPPEDLVDLEATYPGWYRAISWKPHYAVARENYAVDLDRALGLNAQHESSSEYGIAYAYAEIIGDTRGEMRMVPESSVPMEIYLNGALVYSPESEDERPKIYLKLAKNTLLLKFYKQPGALNFRLNFEEMTTPIRYRWGKAPNLSL